MKSERESSARDVVSRERTERQWYDIPYGHLYSSYRRSARTRRPHSTERPLSDGYTIEEKKDSSETYSQDILFGYAHFFRA